LVSDLLASSFLHPTVTILNMKRGFLNKPPKSESRTMTRTGTSGTPVAPRTNNIEEKSAGPAVILIPDPKLEVFNPDSPDPSLSTLIPTSFNGSFHFVTLPFPGTFKFPNEPATLCVLFPGTKDRILALPDFPTRLTPPPYIRWPFAVEDVPGMGKAMIALLPFEAGGLILNERPLILFPAAWPSHANLTHPYEIMHKAAQMLDSPFREAFYQLHNCKNSGPVSGAVQVNGICDTNAIFAGELPGPYMGQYAAVCHHLSRMNHR
jgi:hypothetical protein